MRIFILMVSFLIATSAWAWNPYTMNDKSNFSSSCEYGNGNDIVCHAELVTNLKGLNTIYFVENDSCFNYKSESLIASFEAEIGKTEYSISKYYKMRFNSEIRKQWSACIVDNGGKVRDILSVLVIGYSD